MSKASETSSTPGKTVFGNQVTSTGSTSTTTNKPSIFGNSKPAGSQSIFGNSKANNAIPVASSSTTTTTNNNMFGTKPTTTVASSNTGFVFGSGTQTNNTIAR